MKTAACLLLLLCSTLAFFWKIVFTDEYTLFGQHDMAVQAYPWHQFTAYAISHGVLPLWDPYTWGGHLFIGEMGPGLFYPLNLLLYLCWTQPGGFLPLRAMEGFLILGHFLAACFTFLLARRLGISRPGAVVAGLCFALSGFLGRLSVGWWNVFHSALWLPLVFHLFVNAVETRRLAGRIFYAISAGLFLALSVLAGHHNPPLYIAATLFLFSLFLVFSRAEEPPARRAWQVGILLLVCLLSAFAFSAIQVLPTAEFGTRAMRWAGLEVRPGQVIPYEELAQNSWQPRDLAGFLFSHLNYSSEISAYLGILPLLLAVFALLHLRESRYIRFCAFLLAVALLYALGKFSLLNGLSYALIPFLDKAREPVRALYVLHFSMALLAGFGMDLWLRPMSKSARRNYERRLRTLGVVTTSLVALVFGGYVVKVWVLDRAGEGDNLVFMTVLILVLSTGLFYARRFFWLPRRWLGPLAVLLLLFDFSFFNTWGIFPRAKFDGKTNFYPEEYYKSNAAIRFLSSQPDHFRVDIRDGSLPPAIGDVHRIQTILGYGAAVYLDYWDFLWSDYAALGRPLDLLNVRYIVSRQDLGGLKAVQGGEIKLYGRPNALPRAWIVHMVEIIEDKKAQIRRINEPSFDPRNSAVTNAALDIALQENAASPMDQALITSYEPNSIALETATTDPGLLVLSEVDYPGWEVFVDGKPARIYRADGILRAVALTGGRHNVAFRYRPRSVLIGLWLLVLGSLTLIGVAAWHWKTGRTPWAPTSQ